MEGWLGSDAFKHGSLHGINCRLERLEGRRGWIGSEVCAQGIESFVLRSEKLVDGVEPAIQSFFKIHQDRLDSRLDFFGKVKRFKGGVRSAALASATFGGLDVHVGGGIDGGGWRGRHWDR